MEQKEYYLGLDIGTDSVGYAVTNEQYDLLKFRGKQAWGVQVFDAASLRADQRTFRTARRRLDRRQQRVLLVQELFAKEIAKKDPGFFIRIKESELYADDSSMGKGLFRDDGFTDKDYYQKYPTIHHLIDDLMNSKETHDVRLVYLACAWLVAHRGHFLSNIGVDNMASIKDFSAVYSDFTDFFTSNGYEVCWELNDIEAFSEIIKKKASITTKKKELTALLAIDSKKLKESSEEFPFSRAAIISLLAGGTVKLKELFNKDEYADAGSVSLDMDEDKLGEAMAAIGDDYDLIVALRAIHDWAVLVETLGNKTSISAAKVAVYEQHQKDLQTLKQLVIKYLPEKYNEIFREIGKKNYAAYAYHTDEKNGEELKKTGKEEFSKFILNEIKTITPDEKDSARFSDMKNRLELRTFMPKQRDTDNRVIPYQLYLYELKKILDNAAAYLGFLNDTDREGLRTKDKILSVMSFRIPYFVGPLNTHSSHAWIVRKADKIYPWNFEKVVDLDASEQRFIERMTNTCTYLPGEPVLPKDSLCYHKFMVLNEINNIRINGQRISVELKQNVYNDLFMNVKKVTRKRLVDYLQCNGYLEKGQEDSLTGIDDSIKANLQPQVAFKRLTSSGILSEQEVESIIERASYAEDKSRLGKWLDSRFPNLSTEDKKYISNLRLKDFGRLSRRFLCELEGVEEETGEVTTILRALWETQYNLMEILSDKFTFTNTVDDFRKEYYSANKHTLSDVLDDLYISNAVKRPIYRTIDIVGDVKKAFGNPKKIFIEVTRGATEEQRGKRTQTRRQQILDFYARCKDEDVKILRKQLEDLGDYADNKLQGDRLFLYFMQMGKCMYSGTPLVLEKLGTKEYDIDHIYPQAFVKDDSIINNKVLVLSKENGEKKDNYPIKSDIRHRMSPFWDCLKEKGFISDEKYKRLIRSTPFTEEEKYTFINRQITETSQAVKAVAQLLKARFPEAEIVYSKAKLVSDFRQEFDLLKSRTFNDLHHAVDAYLNIVVGNVYDMRFSKHWFSVNSQYSMKTKTIFTQPLVINGRTIWDGEEMLKKVKRTAVRNTARFGKYAFFKRGGLFDQMPVSKAEGLVPLKKGMRTDRYGGYNKAAVMFFIPVKYTAGKKTEILIMSVELLYGKQFLEDENFAKEYSRKRLMHILGKEVDSVSFPMGIRPWKANTVLSLDGFRVCISGSSSGGRCLIAQPMVQFSEDAYWMTYLKRVERFCEKCKERPNYLYDEEYDKVSSSDNVKLYEIYLSKLQSTIYAKRVNCPVSILERGKERFRKLSIQDQCMAIMNIHQVFGRIAGGCDLRLIGGAEKAASTNSFSSTVSNWKKNYSDVRIIDASASGLWEKQSDNLLDLV